MVETMSTANRPSRIIAPTKPNVSHSSAKTKSVCASGRNPEADWDAPPIPLPKNPPEPTAMRDCIRL